MAKREREAVCPPLRASLQCPFFIPSICWLLGTLGYWFWECRFNANWRQENAPAEPSYGKPVNEDLVISLAVAFNACGPDFNRAEGRAAFAF